MVGIGDGVAVGGAGVTVGGRVVDAVVGVVDEGPTPVTPG